MAAMGAQAGLQCMSRQEIEAAFPNLSNSGYSITSPATAEYNCIAWASGDTGAWWWPDPMNLYYWPSEIPRENTLEAFIKAYELSGYVICNDSNYEEGFGKIAIYVNDDKKPTHAARQLSSGRWTSKLGNLEDIEHTTLGGLRSLVYGTIAVFMKRPGK